MGLQVIEQVVHGRRRKLLVQDCIPVYYPNLYITMEHSGRALDTTKKYLEHLAVLEEFLVFSSIDLIFHLEQRPHSQYLTDSELSRFVSDAGFSKETLALKYAGMRLHPTAYKSVGKVHAQQRIELVRDYLNFLYDKLGDHSTRYQAVARLNTQLGGTKNAKKKSLFERWGYPGVKVNTHAFRHELNTAMHQAGLSQLLIDAFSGRTTKGSVYNHETIEERTQGVADYHPKTKHSTAAQRLDKVKTNQPLNLVDVRELHEGEQDRIIHQTHLGVCVHNFASEPCPKMGACLDCGRLGCVKGDDVKLCNLREECDDLKRRLDKALNAQSRGVFGASESAKKLGEKLFKCEALIQTLENPELENGAIVWNADNGWTLTKNAAAMSGLIEVKFIEENQAQEALPSLGDVLALLDEIEG